MTANEFIENWLACNPEDCQRLARAAIQIYCLDRDWESSEPFINLEKRPDLKDVDRAITNAINETSFIQEAENTESTWSHCVGIT
jgi:hypothetical protein